MSKSSTQTGVKVAKSSKIIDPRQALFLEYYMKPGSATFSNIYQSAVKAGYTKEYAENMRIHSSKWVSENVGEITKQELVKKAKRVLNKSLDSQDERLAQDTAKFVAKTDIEFSEKTETTLKLPQPLLGGDSVKD